MWILLESRQLELEHEHRVAFGTQLEAEHENRVAFGINMQPLVHSWRQNTRTV